ncbi:hypothetical protein Hanom_Chr02g00143271 [Helianthus anomalus]
MIRLLFLKNNISVFYIDYHVVFYIHSSTIVCLKFVWTDRVWTLCFSDIHSVICGFRVYFMTEIVVFMTLYTL